MSDFVSNNIFFVFVIWMVFAVATAVLASRKKRNIIFWMLMGCIFGVFGIIIVLLLPVKNKNRFEVPHADKIDSRLKYLKTMEEFKEYKEKQIKNP